MTSAGDWAVLAAKAVTGPSLPFGWQAAIAVLFHDAQLEAAREERAAAVKEGLGRYDPDALKFAGDVLDDRARAVAARGGPHHFDLNRLAHWLWEHAAALREKAREAATGESEVTK